MERGIMTVHRCMLLFMYCFVWWGVWTTPPHVHGYTVRPLSTRRNCLSILHLKSDQGMQLVAAYHAMYSSRPKNATDETVADFDDEEVDWDNMVVPNTKHTPVSATTPPRSPILQTAKSVLSRMWHWALHDNDEYDNEDDDVVLYPIVGATWVRDGPDHGRVLPSSDMAHAVCRLPNRNETLYGWYSPACKIEFVAASTMTTIAKQP
jgi:hypothetical protein